ncbi:hypothetical protein [Winogradskyella psychrotolerans]|uniref:hypothetical protein n=1 Tax=Winogradskyella psychrotolerans TaxID=1344585 RepID=UPI001C07A080|nr:hypothetical protein [Winogradskyella psychrotolerans]MBU2929913.1 hypothetical protein [Winogradskyella psychrotolerans]
MKSIKYGLITFISFIILNSCSNDDDAVSCPQTENATMTINGEVMDFQILGRGIDLDNDGSGHTLSLNLASGFYTPQQDTYAVTLKLPYKKTGTDIIEEFNYLRVQNGSSAEGDFVQSELISNVTVNKNTCFSATFSGSAIIGGNEVVITEGSINHTYSDPFD